MQDYISVDRIRIPRRDSGIAMGDVLAAGGWNCITHNSAVGRYVAKSGKLVLSYYGHGANVKYMGNTVVVYEHPTHLPTALAAHDIFLGWLRFYMLALPMSA